MRRNLGFKSTPITHTLNNPRHKRRAIKLIHLPRHADIRIHEWIVVRNHVFIGSVRGDGVLEGIGGASEEEAPEGPMDEMEEGEDAEGTVWWGRGG